MDKMLTPSMLLSFLPILFRIKWITFTTKKNTVCWMVIQYLSKSSSKADNKFCNSEWGPEATEAMCNEVRAYKVPGKDGKVLTLGDYIDRTPKELIVKVMLEEKVFDTWYGGRTVLLGDGKQMFLARSKLVEIVPVGVSHLLFDIFTFPHCVYRLLYFSVPQGNQQSNLQTAFHKDGKY